MPPAFSPTAEQQAVIDDRDGTLVVLAAVGSGKTSTLARRVAALVSDDGIAPERILGVTFTNRAAAHMRAAVAGTLGPAAARRVHLGTFHALCADILREAASAAGLPADLRVIDEDDVDELLRELGAHTPHRVRFRLQGDAAEVPLGEATVALWREGRWTRGRMARPFVDALIEQGAVDFASLVLLTRALLREDDGVRAAWAGRFDAVVVDEVQDTHLSEYAVLRVLAENARSRCFVGDLDQTIYGWRGSAPQALLGHLEADLGPVRRRALTASFRSTRALVALADAVAADMPERASAVAPGPGLAEGRPARVEAYADEGEEVAAIAEACAARLADGAVPGDLAVLARTNQQITALSRAFADAGVPCTTVESLRVFRRPEVKDTLALARLVADRGDEAAARRAARRLVRAADADLLRRLRVEGRPAGLRVADLLDPEAVAGGDPLARLSTRDAVVLDTETTGLDPEVDEVVEIAAVRMRDGVASTDPADRLHLLVKNTVPVGLSAEVHHISDAVLAADGRAPADAFARLVSFLGDAPVAGHNVGFDLRMLAAHGDRVGVPVRPAVAWDTLDAARRLVAAPRHTLGSLVAQLALPVTPTHRALDDVLATIALATALRARAVETAGARRALLDEAAPAFAGLRAALDEWAARDLRPADLVAAIVARATGPMNHRDARRRQVLAELPARIAALDEPTRPPWDALGRVLEQATLSRDVDALAASDGVRLITVHQSKGLEFDHVWVPGLVDGTLPGFRALDDPAQLAEERRVFYVALTRARRTLTLTWHHRDAAGRPKRRSRFLDAVSNLLVEG